MNSYNYKALVVDDELQINEVFIDYGHQLKEKGLNITFDIINKESEYREEKPYDLLLIDYKLESAFLVGTGEKFIAEFRKRNLISKVILYSSSFIYEPSRSNYDFYFKDKETFDIFNNKRIDKIVAKANTEMMIDAIVDSLKDVDILAPVLVKVLTDYKEKGIEVEFLDSSENIKSVSELIDSLILDNQEGRNFREKILQTILTLFLKSKF